LANDTEPGAAFCTYIWAEKILNKGATKGKISSRCFEVYHASVQKVLFQLLQWIQLEFGPRYQALCWSSLIYLFWPLKILNKGAAIGQAA